MEPEVATDSDDGGGGGDMAEEPATPDDDLEAAEDMAGGVEDVEAEPDQEAPEPEGEPDVEEVDLTEDDLTGSADDLFTGTDDAQGGGSDDTQADDSEDSDDSSDEDPLDALDARGESMEEAINDGAARLAVVGLDDDEQSDLQEEFTEVFEAFRLGYFGSRFMEEYIFAADDEEVDPTWGLFGACLTCCAFVVWMRPDGDEMVGKAREAVENIAGGSI
jgi:hypothetical protein